MKNMSKHDIQHETADNSANKKICICETQVSQIASQQSAAFVAVSAHRVLTHSISDVFSSKKQCAKTRCFRVLSKEKQVKSEGSKSGSVTTETTIRPQSEEGNSTIGSRQDDWKQTRRHDNLDHWKQTQESDVATSNDHTQTAWIACKQHQ